MCVCVRNAELQLSRLIATLYTHLISLKVQSIFKNLLPKTRLESIGRRRQRHYLCMTQSGRCFAYELGRAVCCGELRWCQKGEFILATNIKPLRDEHKKCVLNATDSLFMDFARIFHTFLGQDFTFCSHFYAGFVFHSKWDAILNSWSLGKNFHSTFFKLKSF